MLFRAATADPADLDRAAAYPADDGRVPPLSAERIRDELAGNRFRPEWIWFAEDEYGELPAPALWWGRADSGGRCLRPRAGYEVTEIRLVLESPPQ
ncbi:hypothetical protein [Streptomyces peucetius]